MAAAVDMVGRQRIITEGTMAEDNDRTMRIAAKAIEIYCTQAQLPNPLEEPLPRQLRRRVRS